MNGCKQKFFKKIERHMINRPDPTRLESGIKFVSHSSHTAVDFYASDQSYYNTKPLNLVKCGYITQMTACPYPLHTKEVNTLPQST